MKKILLSLMLASLAGVAVAAESSDRGLYVLAGAGQATNNNDQSDLDSALRSAGGVGFASSLSNPTAYKIQIGYQIWKYLAVEGGYLGSNNETYTASGGNLAGPVSASASINGENFVLVPILPVVDQFSILGKVGVADLRVSGTLAGPRGAVSVSGSKTDLTYGIGAKYDFTANRGVFMRVDYDRYNIGNSNASSTIYVWMIDLGYKF
jgi:opacity protein-like surface antigen